MMDIAETIVEFAGPPGEVVATLAPKAMAIAKGKADANAGIVESQYGIMVILILVALALLLTSLFPGMASSMNMMMVIATIAGVLMIFYGEFKLFSANKES